jgi:hypothetical protein
MPRELDSHTCCVMADPDRDRAKHFIVAHTYQVRCMVCILKRPLYPSMFLRQTQSVCEHCDSLLTPTMKSKIYAGWATLAVVMWSWGRATSGANANKGVSTAPLRPSQPTWYHSTIHCEAVGTEVTGLGFGCLGRRRALRRPIHSKVFGTYPLHMGCRYQRLRR